MFENNRIFKEPNIINFPNDSERVMKKSSIYELLMRTQGDYKKVSQILDTKIHETNKLITELTDNIKSLPDDSFEEKLRKLKSDNLETMMLCDEFRKIASRKEKEQENFACRTNDDSNATSQLSRKLVEKPPQPPKPNRNWTHSQGREVNNHHSDLGDGTDWRSWHQHGGSLRQHRHVSSANELWSRNDDDDDDDSVDDELEIQRRETSYKREAAMERLTRSKSGSFKYQDMADKGSFDPDTLVAKWRHKVTVPQPFGMTIREESKQKHRQMLDDNRRLGKSRTLVEFQAEKQERERQELEETKKQFKANPVPAHVYIPLYETMQEDSNQRRQFVREYSKEILKSMEKPFNFYKREMQKQKSESPSNGFKTNSNKSNLKSYHSERQKTIVRAKEIPKSSTNSDPAEKIKEDELFRLIKAEMRSKQLLEESKMPGNMAERQRIQEEKRRKKQLANNNLLLRKRSRSADSSKVNKSIPDFSKIHREWDEEVRMSYKEPHVTQPKPFNLLTEQRPLHRSTNDIEGPTPNNFNSSFNDISKEWNKSILTALEIAKPATNKSTLLREASIKNKMIEEETKMHHKAIKQLARKKREMDVSEKIRKSLEIDALPKGEDKRRLKTKELKIENELRKENYQKELDEMMKKINQKPLLLEAPVVKTKPLSGYNKDHLEPHKVATKKSRNINGYDERNHFGDPGTYRSSTDASGSIDGMNSYHRNDHSKQWNEEVDQLG